MSFVEIFAAHEWRLIRNCPGRYTLADSPDLPNIKSLIGEDTLVETYRSSKCEDEVLVARLVGGGAVLSYLRSDGTQLHTLNDQSGFERKMNQLEIGISSS